MSILIEQNIDGVIMRIMFLESENRYILTCTTEHNLVLFSVYSENYNTLHDILNGFVNGNLNIQRQNINLSLL